MKLLQLNLFKSIPRGKDMSFGNSKEFARIATETQSEFSNGGEIGEFKFCREFGYGIQVVLFKETQGNSK